MTTEEAARKLKAIKALAEQGAPGERENAQRLLETLAKKYGVSLETLHDEEKALCWFRYSQKIEERLLSQVIFAVTGERASGCRGAVSGRMRKELGVRCTPAEKIEIETNYHFFRRALDEEFDAFYIAFIHKNGIFPSNCDAKDIDEKTDAEELRKLKKASMMMMGMDMHTPLKTLCSENEREGD